MRRRSSTTYRWPLVVASGPEHRPSYVRSTLTVIGILLLIVGALTPGVMVIARIVSAAMAMGLVVRAATAAHRRRAIQSSSVVIADAFGLSRVSPEGSKPIVDWNAPFGVTLLASYGRSNALLAFTTPTQTRYLPMRIDDRSEDDDELFARIAVLADLDLVDGVAHDAALTSSDAAALVRHAAERSAGCAIGRLFLSDGRGMPIALDRATLAMGNRSFDLTSHLEWRTLMFHESTGHAAALYQATWIHQNGFEVVLVAPMPASIVPRQSNRQPEARGRLEHALTRDLRLLQSPTEPPPSRDLRVAIDRPFMMAVRRALDEAPLASRASVSPQREPRTEGRDSIA